MSLKLRSWVFAAFLLLTLALVAYGIAPNLGPRTDVSLGPDGCDLFDCSSDPQDVVLIDVDGDGSIDAVTANNGSDDVTVLLNNGSGGMDLVATLAAGSGPSAVGAADFDNDGNVDLAVVNVSDSSVSLFSGNGDGTFGAPSTVAVGLFPEDIVVADFDEDGDSDFATSDLFGDTVTIRLGNGDGTFADAISIVLAPLPSGMAGPVAMALGDFDEDGNTDIAVTLDDDFPGQVAILLGDGTGNFTEQPNRLSVGDSPLGIAVGELNGDGNEDLAVPNWFDDTVSVLFGNGDGTFAAGPVLQAGLAPEDVVIADLDRDGAADIVTLDGVGSETADGLLVVIPGNGDGTFAAAATFDVGAGPSAVAVADLNGSGALDVVTTHFDSNDLAVLLNQVGSSGCTGDCNGNGAVSISELVLGVNIALGVREAADCLAMDRDGSGTVNIGELVAAVNSALGGCPG